MPASRTAGSAPIATVASRAAAWSDALILLLIFAFTLAQLEPRLLVLDTMTVGGDTPAHNYLASHLRESFFHHGHIVSWASGWWAGFPLFQYYFYLPYLLIAALSCLIPFNVAFKLVNVLGILALPGAAYVSARWMRLPRPVPILLAIAMLPFLFVRSHTMWGVNVFSSLAGMIANSISFPIMLLTIASIYRDARDGQARLRSALLAFLLLSSHFFTSIMAGVTLAILPLILPPGERLRALKAMIPTGLLAVLLMAWWLIPLVATRDCSVDFGTNWDFQLAHTLPTYVLGVIGFACIALFIDHRAPYRPAVLLLAWMFASACGLLYGGFDLSPVFVNVRLWPFVFYGLLALGVAGLGLVIRRRPAHGVLVWALLGAAIAYVAGDEREVHDNIAPIHNWAEFNYAGLERQPGYRSFRELILPLDGTPGRLSNDLSEENNAMGSSRILEAVPHLIDKPILEGGLVNSGLSAYFAYYIQCEMSENCAGYPTIVNPTTFNLVNGTKHLELFNVKHFLARWPTVQHALAASPAWRLVKASGGWQLYELMTHDGHYVSIPRYWPAAVTSNRWKEYALEWFYTPEVLDEPFVFVPPAATLAPALPHPPGAHVRPPLTEADFRHLLTQARGNSGDIDEWLHLGPFPYPPHVRDPVDFAAIPEHGLDPVAGDTLAGKTWHVLFSRSPIFPDRFYDRTEYILAYSFVNIFAPTERDAVLHYSNDDGVAMWLNDQLVVRDTITGLGNFREATVHLKPGRNRLLHKTQQSVGGHFFHVRLTDTEGRPFSDVAVSAERAPPTHRDPVSVPVTVTGRGILSESVTSDRIRFKTDAIGQPHLIKCSYFPNWQVRGAKAIYRVTPAFMLVYPNQADVELYFGRTTADRIGLALTGLGWIAVATLAFRRCRRRA